MTADAVLKFWFEELSPQQQFVKDPALDETIRVRFSAVLEAAARGELFEWRQSARGRLAEIVVLDQFSRNVYRDTPRAFAQDAVALVLAQELVASGLDRELPTAQRAFAYLPYMHSESLQIHEHALVLYGVPGLEGTLQFELRHKVILERFGRYPHRNAILGRPSTSEELAFLQEAGSSF